MKTGDNMKEHPQRLELRERIIDTALNSFATHGIKSITMDDIAAALGISKRTLYEVFSDKETLLMECLLKAQREGDAYVKDVYEKASNVLEVLLKLYQRSIEKFHNTNKKFFEDIKKYPKVYAELMKRRNRDSEETIAFFKLGIQQGYFRDDVNFTIVNLLVREQLDLLMNTDLCKEHSFLKYMNLSCLPISGEYQQKKALINWKNLSGNTVRTDSPIRNKRIILIYIQIDFYGQTTIFGK